MRRETNETLRADDGPRRTNAVQESSRATRSETGPTLRASGALATEREDKPRAERRRAANRFGWKR